MELSTSTWMLLFFILFLVASIWKIWVFLPEKQLADDDTTKEATAELEKLMLKIIYKSKGEIDEKNLFLQMIEDEDFDSKLFWRFNLNRLKHLLHNYYTKHKNISTIQKIYIHLNK